MFKVLTLLELTLSDDIGDRLKALASTKLKRQTVNQATACVRTAHTLHVGFEVPCNSQVGCVARFAYHINYGLLINTSLAVLLLHIDSKDIKSILLSFKIDMAFSCQTKSPS